MRLRLEMNSAGDFASKSKLDPFIKDAYLRWKFTGNHQAYLGMSPTATTDSVDRIWGYRSVEKSALDLQKWGSTRDLGGGPARQFRFGPKSPLPLPGGQRFGHRQRNQCGEEGATGLELPSHRSSDGRVSIPTMKIDRWRPIDGLFRAFWPSSTIRVASAFSTLIRLAMEIPTWNWISFPSGESGSSLPRLHCSHATTGPSIPTRMEPGSDYLPFDPTAKSNFFLGGIDLQVSDDFNLMPNVEVIHYDKREDGTRPTTDVVPRVTFFYNF